LPHEEVTNADIGLVGATRPDAPSIDAIVPRSRHGTYEEADVQVRVGSRG
jgi:hypothetical protein